MQQPLRAGRDRAGLHEAPRESSKQQRDADLHRGEQKRVVLGARVGGRLDVPADVDAVRQRAACELRDQDEEGERESREERLMAARTFHLDSVVPGTRPGQT
jgi:hypothetical protein